jgi:hypothetical protein
MNNRFGSILMSPCARWSKVTYHRVEPVEPGGIPNHKIPYADNRLKGENRRSKSGGIRSKVSLSN